MPINEMIALQGQVGNPLNALAQGYKLGEFISDRPVRADLNTIKVDQGRANVGLTKAQTDLIKTQREKLAKDSNIRAAAMGAMELSSTPFEQWGGVLQRRMAEGQRYGYNADAEREALEMLQTDPEALKAQVDGLVKFGGAMGLLGARKGTYGALTPAIGPDGKPVYIQSDPSGGQPNVVQGYAPPPSAADQQATRDSRQNAALARLLAGGIGGQGGGSQSPDAPPAPNAPTGLTDPFAGMSEDEIARLPPDILKKYVESKTNPQNVQDGRERQANTTRAVQSAKLFIETLQDPEIKSATGPAAILGTANRALGTQAGVIAGRLERLGNKLTLEANSLLKGATTDRDIKFLQGTMPSKYDSVEVWADWYENDYLGTIKANAEANGLDFNSYGLPSTIEANKAPIQTNQGWSIKKVQ